MNSVCYCYEDGCHELATIKVTIGLAYVPGLMPDPADDMLDETQTLCARHAFGEFSATDDSGKRFPIMSRSVLP